MNKREVCNKTKVVNPFTFARHMVGSQFVAALCVSIRLTVVFENLSCRLIVSLHSFQIISKSLTPLKTHHGIKKTRVK